MVNVSLTLDDSRAEFVDSYCHGKRLGEKLAVLLTDHIEAFLASNQKEIDLDYRNGDPLSNQLSVTLSDKVRSLFDEVMARYEIPLTKAARLVVDYVRQRPSDTSHKHFCLRVPECTITPRNPLAMLDNLVDLLLVRGEQIHERDWFKKLQKQYPMPDPVTVPDQGAIVAELQDKGWVSFQELSERLFADCASRPSLYGGLKVRLTSMVSDKLLDQNEEGDVTFYRVHVPEPLTDEESILKALKLDANGDWVNKSWLFRMLNLTDDASNDQHIALGRLYLLVVSGTVESRDKNGDSQWRIKSND